MQLNMTVEQKLRETTESPADYLRGLVKNTGHFVLKTEKQTIAICTKLYAQTDGRMIKEGWRKDTIVVFFDKESADPKRMMFDFYPYSDRDSLYTTCKSALIIEYKNGQESVTVITNATPTLETQFGNIGVTSFDPAYHPTGPNGKQSVFYLDPISAKTHLEKIVETILKTRLPGLE